MDELNRPTTQDNVETMEEIREDQEGLMNDDLLYDLAIECETLLDALHEQSTSSQKDTSLAKLVVEYQQRFSIWAAHLGVFATKSQSLDSRLRYHDEIKDVVARLLDMLSRSVRHALHLYQLEDDDGDEEEEKTSALGTMERALEELNSLGVTIRRSSRARIDAKIEKFAALIDPEPFISTANAAIDFLYPYADPSLRDYLTKTMIYRYSSMRFEKQRRETLKSRRSQQLHVHKQLSPVPEQVYSGNATPMNITTSSVHGHKVAAPLAQNQTGPYTASRSGLSTLDSKPVRKWLNTRFDSVYPPLPPRSPSQQNRATSSIQVGQRSYPALPIEDTSNVGMCEWCGEMVDKRRMSDDDWRRHTDRDLRPYVCLAEECQEGHPTYPAFGDWFVHMARQHSPRWYQKAYPSFDWVCLFCKDTQNLFSNPDELHLHLTTNHGTHLPDEQLNETSKQCKILRRRARNECLLCGMVVEEPRAAATPATLKRQKPHLGKAATKTPRRSLDTTHPGPHTKTQSSSESSDESADATQGQIDTTEAKTMARHIGDHLQGLMLLTLRLDCLQHDKNPESQRDDADSDSVDVGDSNDSFRDIEDPQVASEPISEDWGDQENGPAGLGEGGSQSEGSRQSDETQIPDATMPLDDVPRRYDNLPLEADQFLQELILSGAYQGHLHTPDTQQPKSERTGSHQQPPKSRADQTPHRDLLPEAYQEQLKGEKARTHQQPPKPRPDQRPHRALLPPEESVTAADVRECTTAVRHVIMLRFQLMTSSNTGSAHQHLAVEKQLEIDGLLEELDAKFRWWISLPKACWSKEDEKKIRWLIDTLPKCLGSYTPQEPSSSSKQRSPMFSFIGDIRKRIKGEKTPRK